MNLSLVIRLPGKRGGRGSERKPSRRGRRGRRLRWALALSLVLAASGAGLWVYLAGEVRGAFDTRLWSDPDRYFSDVLELERGSSGRADDLAARLTRSGYAQVEGALGRPGRFRRLQGGIEVHLRAFDAPQASARARRVEVLYDDRGVRRLRDAGGRRLDRVLVEPELLATVYRGRQEERFVVPIEQVPPHVIQAILAAEDTRFFQHRGIDTRGVVRAALANVKAGSIVQGGSTITQQTVKNVFLHHQRTWSRKLREGLLAVALDAHYPKERILEVYLNEVYLGQRGPVAICGLEAASRFYFGHGVADLGVSEAALLAGLIRSPGSYNPFRDEERSLHRRTQVLEAMVRQGWLSLAAARVANDEPLQLASGSGGFGGAPYAVEHARQQVRGMFPEIASRPGLRVYTTIDTRLQSHAERALAAGLARLEERPGAVRDQLGERQLQGAVVVLRPGDGALMAMIGGRDYRRSQFNRATQARRQPGSCFKPFVYAAAFDAAARREAGGATPATMLADAPLTVRSGGQVWRPANFDREFRGPVTARRALEESLNVPSIRLAREVGIDRVIRAARAAGIESPLDELPSLALGTSEVAPLELANSYATFARQGVHQDVRVLVAVREASGTTHLVEEPLRQRRLDRSVSFLVNDLMQGVFLRGTARSAARLGFHGPAAGKTGTTDDTRDSWFVGYDGDVLSLVWLGYDDNARTGLTGATGALPIWVDLMREKGPARSRLVPHWPDDILIRSVDPQTGRLVSRFDPAGTEEFFILGTLPEDPGRERGPFRRFWNRIRGHRAEALPGV